MIGNEEAEAKRVVLWWGQDPADYSWIATDPDGCQYRVTRLYVADGQTFWGYCWRDGDYFRIGSGLFNTAEDCRSFIDLVLASEEMGIAA